MKHTIEVGERSHFAVRLTFTDEPDKLQWDNPALSFSWGKMQLWAGGQNLCLHYENNTTVDSIHWYLLPILEWLTENWDSLLHEEKIPVQNSKMTAWEALQETKYRFLSKLTEVSIQQEKAWQEWWSRHALLSARNGGIFPDIIIRRKQQNIEFSWGSTRIAGMPKDFIFVIPSGSISLDAAYTARVFHDLLQQSCRFLLTRIPDSIRFNSLQKNINYLSSPERKEIRLAWMTGLGIKFEQILDRFQKLYNRVRTQSNIAFQEMFRSSLNEIVIPGTCQASLMFGSVSPLLSDSDIIKLADILVESYKTELPSSQFDSLRRFASIRYDESKIWDQGYELAEQFSEETHSLDATSEFVDIDNILKMLDIHVENVSLSDRNIRGVAIASHNHKPTILINTQHVRNEHLHGTRFTKAHELCHLLYDQEKGLHLAHVTGPWAPVEIEKRANAFAAMLLAPDVLIEKWIHNIPLHDITLQNIFSFSSVLQTSPKALIKHLLNRGFINFAQYDSLDSELDSCNARSASMH